MFWDHHPTPSGGGGTSGSAAGAPHTAGQVGVSGSSSSSGAPGFAGSSSAGSGTTSFAGSGTAGTSSAGSGAGGASAGSTSAGGASGAATGGASSGAGGGSTGVKMSKGCNQTSTVTFGTVPGETGSGATPGGYVTIQSSGQNRGFALRLPENYDKSKPYPLFFGFHWNGGTSKDVDTGGTNGYSMAHFGLQALSKNGAFFVAPQGNGNGWGNGGGADLKFVDDMVKLIEDNYCIDESRIFTNGFSYGGGMSYGLACARASVFRAAAIYEGAQLSGCDGGKDPIALWQMVGLTDTTCGMNLATPIRDRFVQNNGCTAQNPPQPANPPPYLKTGGHICTDYAGCSAGHPLRWCVHQSGHGNAVVDGSSSLYNECANPGKGCSDSCPCTWVPADVWKFFSQFLN